MTIQFMVSNNTHATYCVIITVELIDGFDTAQNDYLRITVTQGVRVQICQIINYFQSATFSCFDFLEKSKCLCSCTYACDIHLGDH